MKIGRFDTPLEDYGKDIQQIKTFEDFQKVGEKYSMILSDAKPVFDNMTEENFPEFISWFPNCFKDVEVDEEWAEKYGAVALPYLFIRLAPLMIESGMSSGFCMHRLIDENLAEIKDGMFVIKERSFVV